MKVSFLFGVSVISPVDLWWRLTCLTESRIKLRNNYHFTHPPITARPRQLQRFRPVHINLNVIIIHLPRHTNLNTLFKQFRPTVIISWALKLNERALLGRLCPSLVILMTPFSLHASQTGIPWMRLLYYSIQLIKVQALRWSSSAESIFRILPCPLLSFRLPVLYS